MRSTSGVAGVAAGGLTRAGGLTNIGGAGAGAGDLQLLVMSPHLKLQLMRI